MQLITCECKLTVRCTNEEMNTRLHSVMFGMAGIKSLGTKLKQTPYGVLFLCSALPVRSFRRHIADVLRHCYR